MTEPTYLEGITDNRERMLETIYRNSYKLPGSPGIEARNKRAKWEQDELNRQADALEADGWVRQRKVGHGDLEFLANRAVVLTATGILIRKRTNWFVDGTDGYEVLRYMMDGSPVIIDFFETLDENWFPATVLHEGDDAR